MTITIKRDTGWSGSASNIQILINGEKVANIAHKKEVVVNLPDDKATLKVKQLGMKSNEIEVRKGDVIEIKSPKWENIYYFLLPILFLLIQVSIPSFRHRLIAIGVLGIIIIALILIINGFHIEIIDKK